MATKLCDELGGQRTRETRSEWRPKNVQGMGDRTRVGEGAIPTRVWLDGQNARRLKAARPFTDHPAFNDQNITRATKQHPFFPTSFDFNEPA